MFILYWYLQHFPTWKLTLSFLSMQLLLGLSRCKLEQYQTIFFIRHPPLTKKRKKKLPLPWSLFPLTETYWPVVGKTLSLEEKCVTLSGVFLVWRRHTMYISPLTVLIAYFILFYFVEVGFIWLVSLRKWCFLCEEVQGIIIMYFPENKVICFLPLLSIQKLLARHLACIFECFQGAIVH